MITMTADDCITDAEAQARHARGVSDCRSPHLWQPEGERAHMTATEAGNLSLAEEMMALYRQRTGDQGPADLNDLAGVLITLEAWARSTGYALSWRVWGEPECLNILADSTGI